MIAAMRVTAAAAIAVRVAGRVIGLVVRAARRRRNGDRDAVRPAGALVMPVPGSAPVAVAVAIRDGDARQAGLLLRAAVVAAARDLHDGAATVTAGRLAGPEAGTLVRAAAGARRGSRRIARGRRGTGAHLAASGAAVVMTAAATTAASACATAPAPATATATDGDRSGGELAGGRAQRSGAADAATATGARGRGRGAQLDIPATRRNAGGGGPDIEGDDPDKGHEDDCRASDQATGSADANDQAFRRF